MCPLFCGRTAVLLFHDGHLVYQMFGTGKLVDDKEAVADVEADVAAVVGIEEEVAHGAFPATVEVDTDKLAIGIEHRAAGVAACGVVGGNEGHGHLATEVGIAAIVLGLIELLELGFYHIVVDIGVLLVHDASEGAIGGVVDSILGAEALYMAVGHTQGKVGIGEEIAVGILHHHTTHIGAHEAVDLALVDIVGLLLVGGIGIR